MDVTIWLALLSGIAVAAACGLRAFLPLFLLGLAGRADFIQLRGGAEWLATDLALIALSVATVVEVAGDKIPMVDHALDVVGTVLRPAAAWLGAYAVLQSWPTPWAQIAAVALGTTAFGIHALKAKIRIGSSAVTLASANPIVSVVEDGIAFAIMVVAILAPVLAIIVPVALVMAFRRRRRRRPAS